MNRIIRLLVIVVLMPFIGNAQHSDNPIPYFTTSQGLGITPKDSSFSINFRFRIQNRIAMHTVSDKDLSVKEWEMIVRRIRLRLEGFVFSSKFAYTMQLSFSRGDMDWDVTNYPNIVRDAMLFYKPNKHLTIGIGQAKLPGNRQRIISSGDQQFIDRSIVNALFTIDRDYGVQVYYDNHIGGLHYNLRGAISNGEGRNVALSNAGLLYSTRVELYPLGKFTNGGDYFEADLMREAKPKLAIAGTYAFNDDAVRSGGTLGLPLFAPRSFVNYGGDILLKYNGWAISTEALRRECDNPVTTATDGQTRFVYNGWGVNSELSYVFKNNFYSGGRFSRVVPLGAIKAYTNENNLYTVVIGKFIKGHRLKVQADATYIDFPTATLRNSWQFRFQVELGI